MVVERHQLGEDCTILFIIEKIKLYRNCPALGLWPQPWPKSRPQILTSAMTLFTPRRTSRASRPSWWTASPTPGSRSLPPSLSWAPSTCSRRPSSTPSSRPSRTASRRASRLSSSSRCRSFSKVKDFRLIFWGNSWPTKFLYLTSAWPQSDLNLTSIWPQLDLNLTSIWLQLDLNLTSTWPQYDLNLTSTWPQPDLNLTSIWPQLDLNQTLIQPRSDLEIDCRQGDPAEGDRRSDRDHLQPQGHCQGPRDSQGLCQGGNQRCVCAGW